jgi:hypothetical protein
MAGCSTVSRSGVRSRRYCGVDATSSLVPTHAAMAVGSMATPSRRCIQAAAASRNPTEPIDAG